MVACRRKAAGQPGGWLVAGELHHRLLPEGAVGAERVGGVGQQHRPGARVAELELVLHPVDGRPGEVQLPGGPGAGSGERRADPGALHLLVQPHLLQGAVGVEDAEGHPGGCDDRAAARGRGLDHPGRIAAYAAIGPGFADVEVLPIEHDFWRFYGLVGSPRL